MLLNVDAKALEWVCKTYLSQDPIAIDELINEIDQHTDNQTKFNLPSRYIAKIFVFRLIFGGTAYAYANDAEFIPTSSSVDFWQQAIDAFYEKYKGHALWDKKVVETVKKTGQLVMPTGRIYKYQPYLKNGEHIWPRTTILNYPVQGLGADIMSLARIYVFNKLKELNLKSLLISSVHDSIVLDCPKEEIDICATILRDGVNNTPIFFEKRFGVKFNLPMRSEVSFGNNMKQLEDYIFP